MISLGAIELSDHLVLAGVLDTAGVATSTVWTLGGRPVIHSQSLTGGRSLALQGENHFTLDQLIRIRELMQAARPVELVHPQFTGMVYITGITSPEPVFERSDPPADWPYSAEITLREAR